MVAPSIVSAHRGLRLNSDVAPLSPRDSVGLADGAVEVVPYRPAWATLYEEESSRITRVLAQHGLMVRLEHTGSTAVPGLPAKPILDILGGHTVDIDRSSVIAALTEAGYTHRGEQGIPGRDFFRRGAPRQYHLHVTTLGSSFWHDHRDFRDYLRTHPERCAEYALLKRRLAAQFPRDRPAYIDGKADFVHQTLVLARAGAIESGSSS